MVDVIPVDDWHYTGVVVRDYRQVVCNFARFFGIERWEVRRIDGKYLADATFEGASVKPRYISVRGRNQSLGIELIQPVDGPSSYQAMLDSPGEGMHHVAATVCDPKVFSALRPSLADAGIGIRQSGTLYGVVDVHLLDTRDALSNTLIEVWCPRTADWRSKMPADEVLQMDLSHLGPQFMPTGKMLHVGVVCKDRNRTKENLKRLFGMERWIEFHIESGVTMDNCTFYGESVFHEYDNHVGRVGALCFELITSKTDKNVYHEFLTERGEGMHHTFPCLLTADEWRVAQPALANAGMPVIQGGNIADIMEYYYVDTRKYLPGITTEVVIPRRDDWLKVMFPNPDDAWILTG